MSPPEGEPIDYAPVIKPDGTLLYVPEWEAPAVRTQIGIQTGVGSLIGCLLRWPAETLMAGVVLSTAWWLLSDASIPLVRSTAKRRRRTRSR